MAESKDEQEKSSFVSVMRWFRRHWSKTNLLVALLSVAGLAYFGSMFVAPVLKYWGDWPSIQDVWERWQALNVGILAFAASVVGLQIARVHERERTRREFVAARALLPQALSDLAEYCKECSEYLDSFVEDPSGSGPLTTMQVPDFPEGVYPAFERCIRSSPSLEAEYLSSLISDLQVHRSRLRSLENGGVTSNRRLITILRHTRPSYLAALLVIRSKIDALLPWARAEQGSIDQVIGARELRTASVMMSRVPEQEPEVFELAVKQAAKAMSNVSDCFGRRVRSG